MTKATKRELYLELEYVLQDILKNSDRKAKQQSYKKLLEEIAAEANFDPSLFDYDYVTNPSDKKGKGINSVDDVFSVSGLQEVRAAVLTIKTKERKEVTLDSVAQDLDLALLRIQRGTLTATGVALLQQDILEKINSIGADKIRESVNVVYSDFGGKTLLHMAASLGMDRVVKDLVEKGANVNLVDSDLNTPLHLAILGAKKNDTTLRGMVSNLVDAGAYVREVNSVSKSAIDLAEKKFGKRFFFFGKNTVVSLLEKRVAVKRNSNASTTMTVNEDEQEAALAELDLVIDSAMGSSDNSDAESTESVFDVKAAKDKMQDLIHDLYSGVVKELSDFSRRFYEVFSSANEDQKKEIINFDRFLLEEISGFDDYKNVEEVKGKLQGTLLHALVDLERIDLVKKVLNSDFPIHLDAENTLGQTIVAVVAEKSALGVEGMSDLEGDFSSMINFGAVSDGYKEEGVVSELVEAQEDKFGRTGHLVKSLILGTEGQGHSSDTDEVSSDPAPNAVVAPNTPNISQNISQESNESQQNTGQVFAKSDVVSFGGIDGDKKIAVKSGGVIRLGGSGNKNNDLSV